MNDPKPFFVEIFCRQDVNGHPYEFMKQTHVATRAERQAERARIVDALKLMIPRPYDVEVAIGGPDVGEPYAGRPDNLRSVQEVKHPPPTMEP